MKPTAINNYLETITNPAGRFRSLSGLEIRRDESGLPRYAVRSKTLDIVVSLQGRERILCCPLNHDEAFDLRSYVCRRYASGETEPQLLLGEMLVFNDRDESRWQDILLAEAAPDALTANPAPEEPDANREAPLHYSEGLAAVEQDGKYGYADREGRLVIPVRYDWADAFDEGLAVVKCGDLFGVVDKTGREVFPPVYEDIRWRSDNGVALVCDEGKWTLRSRGGETAGAGTFDFICDFSEGLAAVRCGDKYGYIDRTGRSVIPPVYDEAYSFSTEGLAVVVRNGVTFCIDTDGMLFD